MPIATTTALLLGAGLAAGGSAAAKKIAAKKTGAPAQDPALQPPEVVNQSQQNVEALAAGIKQRRKASGGFFGNIATMLAPRLGNGTARTTYGGGKTLLGE